MTAQEAIEKLRLGPGNTPFFYRDREGRRHSIDDIVWEGGVVLNIYKTAGTTGKFTIPYAAFA